MAAFMLFIFIAESMGAQGNSNTVLRPYDYVMFTLMGIIFMGIILSWWKERLGAWLTIIGLTIFTSILMKYVRTSEIQFLLYTIPSIAILICTHIKKGKHPSNRLTIG